MKSSVYLCNLLPQQAKSLTVPQVFITPEVEPKLAAKLKDIVKRHNVRFQDHTCSNSLK